ncbi:MDR family MFS transporter [Granulicella sp. dw_53]|uniref:MDR family MFS transporter n=1 Tax=Granulicella sp. dw_53 TaxID=2719792 RepID=UPI001BD42824|nr:MDR family MFS transporter [Granulicella sp. dw_53]
MRREANGPDVGERLDPMVWKIAGVVLLGPLMTSLDSTVVNVSLSTLGSELHASLTTIQWVTSGYLLALALMLPLSGWLVDRIGVKRVYLGCFVAFTISSLLCGVATSATGLIGFRVLQGMTGGLIAPMAQMMIARTAGRHVARVMGFMVMPILIGPILGPVVAGAILQHASWRWIFFINLPIGVLATWLAWWILPTDAHETQRRTFDLKGFLLLSPGLVFLLHSTERLSSNPATMRFSVVELLAALCLLAAFVRHGLERGSSALIDVYLFRRRSFSAAAATQFLSNAAIFGGQMMLPLYLLTVRGITPSAVGWVLAPAGFGALFSYPMMGTLTERFGPRAVSASGATLALLGTLPFAFFGVRTIPLPVICVALFVRGLGMGAINIPSIAAAYASIPKQMIPVATTAINILQRLGGPVATMLLAIFLHSRMRGGAAETPHAFAATFTVLCAIHALGVLAALRLPVRRGDGELNPPLEVSPVRSALAK